MFSSPLDRIHNVPECGNLAKHDHDGDDDESGETYMFPSHRSVCFSDVNFGGECTHQSTPRPALSSKFRKKFQLRKSSAVAIDDGNAFGFFPSQKRIRRQVGKLCGRRVTDELRQVRQITRFGHSKDFE